MPKTWSEKLATAGEPVVKPAPMDIAGMKKGQVMLVPTARQIDAFIRTLPAGRAMDARTLRATLARQHGAEVTCPIYTGYHLRTVAEVAGAALAAGVDPAEVTPVWRVLDARAPTLSRLDCGSAGILARRKAEGLD
jgi:hypothetical protein